MSNPIRELSRLFFKSKKIPANLRLFVVLENECFYINNGHVSQQSSAYGFFDHLQKDRGKILDAFAKFEFLIDELIRLKVMGYAAYENALVVDLIEKINLNNCISLLKKWRVIDNELGKKLCSLLEVRNQLAHVFSQSETRYKGQILMSYSVKDAFSVFIKDLQDAWKDLTDIYIKEKDQIDFEKIKQDIINFQEN